MSRILRMPGSHEGRDKEEEGGRCKETFIHEVYDFFHDDTESFIVWWPTLLISSYRRGFHPASGHTKDEGVLSMLAYTRRSVLVQLSMFLDFTTGTTHSCHIYLVVGWTAAS